MKSQFFLDILIVPIMYECGKLKKAIGNKILFPVILEQCEKAKPLYPRDLSLGSKDFDM